MWKSGQLRRCGRCRHHLPVECFNRHGDGLQWWCRSCFAAYFRKRGDTHRRQSSAAKVARARALRAQVLDHVRHHPCVDCGEADPVVLEFDHLGEKIASISVLLSQTATRKAVEAEIARCEVEFDHVGLKRDSVTRLAWYGCSLGTIDAEIAKCDVRCANCHRRATARRGGHFRFSVLSSAAPP